MPSFSFGSPVDTISPATAFTTSINSLSTPTAFWGGFTVPFHTNVWWQNLVLATTQNLFQTQPYQVKSLATGIDISYPGVSYGNMTIDASGKSITTAFHRNIRLGFSETSTARELTAHDDLSASIRNTITSNTTYLDTYFVKGAPYITAKYTGLTPNINTQHSITNVNGTTSFPANITATKFKVVLNNGQTWLIYFDSSVTLNVANSSGWRMLASGTFTGVVRAAVLVSSGDETMLDTYANRYPTAGTVGATVSGDTAVMTFNYAATGSGSLLMLALPHQQDHLTGLISTSFKSLKGGMQGITGDSWAMAYSLPTITWNAPRNISAAHLSAVQQAFVSDQSYNPTSATDSYGNGKQMAKAARLALIGDVLGNTSGRDTLLGNLKTRLNSWLNGTNSDFLKYDTTWGGISTTNGLASSGADFGNGIYNDHHFHYGYFIYAAAVVAKFDASWAATYGVKVNMLVRDIMNTSASDTYFPRFRHTDWYEGHSWAHGLSESASAKDQESFSESINAWYGITLWGKATGNDNVYNHGRILLAREIQTTKKYVQITDSSVYPAPFSNNSTVGITFAAKVDHTTFFGSNLEFVNEINNIPITPITEAYIPASYVAAVYDETTKLMTRNPTFSVTRSGTAVSTVAITSASALNKGYNAYVPTISFSGGGGSGAAATAVVASGELTSITVTNGGTGYTSNPTAIISQPAVTDAWKSFIVAKRAITNAETAWTEANALSTVDSGNSVTNLLYWIATRSGSGQESITLSAGDPLTPVIFTGGSTNSVTNTIGNGLASTVWVVGDQI